MKESSQIESTTEAQRLEIAARLSEVAREWGASPLYKRSCSLLAIADALARAESDLVPVASRETGLSELRLASELKRTVLQLRLFADTVLDGEFLDVRIDEADSDFALGVRPDLRRCLVPLGPVLNYAASNFPFAFSVAGGDTVSALAAGCPVVVKAHSGHPRLSRMTASVVSQALDDAGAPSGVFDIISGQDAGVAMLRDSRIRAGSFTGSVDAGNLLARVAASRTAPIPFYGELGSLNPVFVTSRALADDATGIVDGFITSMTGSAGQLCTKPGFLFLPSGHDLERDLQTRLSRIAEHRLLYPGIAQGYSERRATILETSRVEVLHEGSLRFDEDGQGWVTPTLVSTTIDGVVENADRLLEEAFGPLSILVEYENDIDLAAVASTLFSGNLTGTVRAGAEEDTPGLRSLVYWISANSGRVIFGEWPTGVAVTPAMQHGGPWPATTNDSGTSVGTAAIKRFLRPVAFQNTPQYLLPEPLRDDNPWKVPQHRSPAGQSLRWGDRSPEDAAKLHGPSGGKERSVKTGNHAL